MEKLSEKLFKELHDYEDELIPFKFSTDLKSFEGKKLKKVYKPKNPYISGGSIFVFEDNTAFWVKPDGEFISNIYLVNAYWSEKNSWRDAYVDAYCTDDCQMLADIGFITEKQIEKLLDLAKRAREQQHKEEIKKEIQRKLDEISNLKDEL